ncbi:Endonuclease/exonuclease/phosphatase [Gossypium australe]|uniref:Endonuclease/exonuclease/phosphatase n=1 Tax=Gossypium australe TaxID=47621 RepID=A0A5B6UE83_9ROSI|nr:Endonuclease/exonuclease/phosphatase [Gossypium australe]
MELKSTLEGLVDNLERVAETAPMEDDGRSDEDGMDDGNDGNIETWISGVRVDCVINKIGFPNSFWVEANGFVGGIWIIWNANFLVDILDVHPQFSYLFLFSPQPYTKQNLWQYLDSLAELIDGSWIIAGDFNAILDSLERAGGAAILQVCCRWFNPSLFNNGLRDLGSSGAKFTWSRGSLSQRLDRAMCNSVWACLRLIVQYTIYIT